MKVKKSPLKGIEYDFSQCVDIAPIASVTAALASGKSKFTGLRRLKIKESDREIATYNIIYNLGGKIRLIDDTFIIEGVKSFKGGVVCGYNDHRIVMSAAIAALKSEKEVVITDVQAINKSYNGFFDDYCGLGGKVNVFDVGR